jgi:hypothetical protein
MKRESESERETRGEDEEKRSETAGGNPTRIITMTDISLEPEKGSARARKNLGLRRKGM